MLSRYRNCLVTLFRQVHELQAAPIEKRLLALAIQEELLKRITQTERLTRQTRKANKLIKIQLSQKGTHQRDTARHAKAKYEAGENKIQTYRVLISTLRLVGDAVAFIYGDRWDLRKLAAKEDAGFITGKRGTRLERSILRGAFRIGATVVMNDLTHTLRHGDITVFRPDLWPDGGSKFLLVEAKSGRGGNHDRAERQAVAAKQMLEYLSTDTHGEGTLRRISADTTPEYHFQTASRLVTNLPHAGWLHEEVEPGLHYVLIDGNYAGRTDDILQSLMPARPPVFVLSVNSMKNEHLGYYPFPLCFRDPNALFRFFNDDFAMLIFVDMDHVNKVLAAHGLSAKFSDATSHPWQILATTKEASWGEGEVLVGYHLLGRLAAEFLKLDWLLKNTVYGSVGDEVRNKLRELNALYT